MRGRHVPLVVLVAAISLPLTAVAQRGGAGIQPPPPDGRGGRGGARPEGPTRDATQNEPARGTSIIRGVVLAADTGTPIRRAQVRASAPNVRINRLATTDAQGRFEIKDLPAGRYTLSAMKGGFVSLQYGQRRPSESGTPLELGERHLMDKIVIGLPRGSVIAGRITDEFGEPLANAAVTAMRYGYAGGARRLLPANARDTTDDLGAFRLFGLPPGEYVVSANFRAAGGEVTDPAGEPSGYAPTYFPGTPNISEAQRIRVDIGQENAGAIFALVATRLVRISGSLLNSQGMPVTAGNVMLAPADSLGMGGATMSARLERDGQFRLQNVAPGRYVLQARTQPPPGARGGRGAAAPGVEMGRLDFAVGTEDLTGLVVVTYPGATVTGTVGIDTTQQPPFGPDRVQVTARNVDAVQNSLSAPASGGPVAPDWTFQLTNVFDSRLIRATAPQGWTVKAVTLNGQDYTDTPIPFAPGQTVGGIHIVLTDKVTNLSGTIVDSRGEAVASAAVVIFPADDRLWTFQSRFIRAARPDQQGRYQLSGLPPYDDYRIVALTELEDGQAGDPEFLMRVREQGSRFSLNEGETKSVDVKLGR